MLRAGVPSVIMPFLGDQPWWARRLHERGFGPAAVHREKAGVSEIAEALEVALGCRPRVGALAKVLAGEVGCARALEAIEAYRGAA